MKRWLIPGLAIAAVLLVAGLANAASWSQAGNGPGRTGAIGFEGPQTNDTAFEVSLPGTPVRTPVVTEEEAYIATVDIGVREDLDRSALWRIDLANGSVEEALDYPDGWDPLHVTPELMVFADSDDLVALDEAGEEMWRTRVHPDAPHVNDRSYGANPALVGDTLHVAFTTDTQIFVSPDAASVGWEESFVGVMAVDAATGETDWTWQRRSPESLRNGSTDEAQHLVSGDGRVSTTTNGAVVAADEHRAYLYLRAVRSSDTDVHYQERMQYQVWAIEDGEAVWNRSDTEQSAAYAQGQELDEAEGRFCCKAPAVTGTRVLTRLDAFQALNPTTGETVWDSPAGQSDHFQSRGAKAMGVRGDAFIAASDQSVYRLDATTGDLLWQRNKPSPSEMYGVSEIAVSDRIAYIPTIEQPCEHEGQGVEARDLSTGDLLWRHGRIPDFTLDSSCWTPGSPGFGPGIMVQTVKDGTVTVVGETNASLGEPDVPEAQYPGVGNETTIDASGAEPGAFGNATRYMVDWGDGTVTGWQEDPTFTHAYNESGTYDAQVYAGNDANQTSSTFVTMNVGEEAPTEPNWIEERFAKENQEMTFGVLGLAVALGGGAIGVVRRKRKKSILQEELETLEEGFEETKDDPGECEAFLETRKARARSLMMDGTLDEEQFGVIESRVEELGRQLRTSVLDERFQFLPYGLVQSLKKMLADGKITSWEREAVDTLLADEEALSEAQREKVRHQLDRWLVEDSGGEAA